MSANEMPELLPCPFCGSHAHIASETDIDGGRFYFVKCVKCRSKGAEFYAHETCPIFYEGVRDAWNTRSDLCASGQVRADKAITECIETVDELYDSNLAALARMEMQTLDLPAFRRGRESGMREAQDIARRVARERSSLHVGQAIAAEILAALTPAPQPEGQFAENAKKSAAYQQDMGDGRILTSDEPIPAPMSADQWRNSPARFAAHGITAAPSAATPTAQEAVPTEDELDEAWKSGFNAGFGEAKLTTNPPRPSEMVAEVERAFDEIRELNMSGRDENGHRWANSDLIDQTVTTGLIALRALKGGDANG